ncbi:hypothetical protein OY671_011090, partial [Metschnikowia pulcherrima]
MSRTTRSPAATSRGARKARSPSPLLETPSRRPVMNDTHSKVWSITGCSSGFGRILAEMASARGDRVIATARKIEPLADLGAGSAGQLLTSASDVTDPASIAAVMAQAEAAFGRVDVSVNNAGFGSVGAVEELQPHEYRPMFETNLFG